MGRLVSREHASAMTLENFWRSRRCRRSMIKRPTKVLARMPASDRQAVVVQHLVVQAIDQPMLIRQ